MNDENEEMDYKELQTISNLILIQLERIGKAQTLEEAKEISKKTIEALVS